jgi:uncharacterized membrane protein YfcA
VPELDIVAITLLNWDFAAAFLLTLAGGFMFGFAGFGGGLVMTPFLSFIYWPTEGVLITNAIPVIAGLHALHAIRGDIQWREVTPVLGISLVATPVGAYFLLTGDPEFIRRLMGIVVLGAAATMLFGWTYKGPRNVFTSTIAGFLGGGMNGYVGLGGPFISLYFISASQPSQIQRANILVSMMVISLLVVVPLAAGGAFGADTVVRCIALFFPYAGALWVGARVFRRTSDVIYRRVALWLLIAVGISASLL